METLLQELTKAFGWSILNSIWQSGIIYGVLLITLLLAPKLKANIRHNLAYGAVCAMFIWFMVTFFNKVSFNTLSSPAVPAGLNMADFGHYLNSIPQTLSDKVEAYFPQIVMAYALGIMLQLFVILRGFLVIKKLKTKQLSDVPDSWQAQFGRITNALGIHKQIDFRLSGLVNVPVVVGYLKPIILFPVSLVSQLDSDQVEAILIHELSHIRRNDYLLNLIKTTIETVLFFNPFVWLAGRFIHIEREHACDDLVLKLSGKPLTYAHALLKLELIKDNNAPAYALAATGKTQHLYQRIKRITNMKTNYLNTKQQMAALTLAVAGLLSVAWTNPEVKQKAKEVTQTITESEIFSFVSEASGKIEAEADTTKKKMKMKIVITDNNGNTKEYNSLNDLPDSVKKKVSIFSDGLTFNYKFNTDSFKFAKFSDTAFRKLKFDSDAFRTAFRSYPSKEQLEKWKQTQDEFVKKFNSPEQQGQWKKMAEEMRAKMNSPEDIAKYKKMSEDWAKKFNSPEEQEKWKKMQREFAEKARVFSLQADNFKRLGNLQMMKSDSLFKKLSKNISVYGTEIKTINVDGKNITIDGTNVKIDSMLARIPGIVKFNDRVTFFPSRIAEDRELRESEEYKKLRQKYEKDVEDLKKQLKEKAKKN